MNTPQRLRRLIAIALKRVVLQREMKVNKQLLTAFIVLTLTPGLLFAAGY